MNITVRNLSADLEVQITVGANPPEFIDPVTETRISADWDTVTLSVYYDRRFRFGIKPAPPAKNFKEAVTGWGVEKLAGGIENAVLKVRNTYRISGLTDGAVIELCDRAYYSDPSEFESFFKCIPALIYCGVAESDDAEITVTASEAVNRRQFLGFYRLVFRLANFRGIFFNIFRYSAQMGRQKRISKKRRLTKLYRGLYDLPQDERSRRLSPAAVLAEKAVAVIRERLTSKLIRGVIDRAGKVLSPAGTDKTK